MMTCTDKPADFVFGRNLSEGIKYTTLESKVVVSLILDKI